VEKTVVIAVVYTKNDFITMIVQFLGLWCVAINLNLIQTLEKGSAYLSVN